MMEPKYGSVGMTNSALNIDDDELLRNNNITTVSRDNSVSSNNSYSHQSSHVGGMISLQRDTIDWDDLQVKYGQEPPQETPFTRQIMNYMLKRWNKFSFLNLLISLFPIISWLPNYPFKKYLFPDFIAGFTISILHIPQGIAYSILAGLEAVNGLYVSFFPVLIYSFMGTSKHISIGSFAVASMMLRNVITKFETGPVQIQNQYSNTTSDWPPTHLEILTSVCIVTGFIQLAMGFLQLGTLSLILSDHLVSGFSTAVAVHVATSQIPNMLGIDNVPNQPSGALKLIKVSFLRPY